MVLASIMCLSGCDLLDKAGGERPIVLHLSLHDSLSFYDSVHIALTPTSDPANELEHVHRGFLTRPSQVPAYTLKVAEDPFLVKVLAFRKVYGVQPREQVAVATYIYYEGGAKRVERPILPAQVPFNRLSRLTASPGGLEPSFNPDVASYTLKVARGVTRVTLEMLAEYTKAVVALEGDVVMPASPSRILTVGARDTVVTVSVTDLETTRNYEVLVSPEKPPELALDSLWISAGNLTPAFHPDTLEYHLSLPSSVPSVDFKMWPEDPQNTVTFFQGAILYPGAQRTVQVFEPGGLVIVFASLNRGEENRSYTFNISRAQ